MIQVPLALLARAIPGARLLGRPDILVRRLSVDSRQVEPGDLFVCIRGRHQDGHRFAAGAIQRGAVAVMLEEDVPGLEAFDLGVLKVDSTTRVLQDLAAMFYNYPSLKLVLAGITGTSGKTTVAHFLKKILEGEKSPARRVGMLGTIEYRLPGVRVAAPNTTPMAWDLQTWLHRMVEAGCTAAVMEVSSHSLQENRVRHCEFDAAIFTNLSHEHLDFHRTMGEYAAAKRRLFSLLVKPGQKRCPKVAVVNADDPYGAGMARAAAGAKIVRFGMKKPAEVKAEAVRLSADGSRFRLVTPVGEVPVRLRIPGRHNIANALAAAAAAFGLGISLRQIRFGLETLPGVAGRLERIWGPAPFAVIVDFAHKPDALERVLQAVREFTRRKLIVVFGCGGERDKTKRPLMGEIAARLADEVIVTSDNPRSEDPASIIREVAAGCRRAAGIQKKGLHERVDRKEAIRLALKLAKTGDTVLLAGKGHESYQIVGTRILPFNDRNVALQMLRQGR